MEVMTPSFVAAIGLIIGVIARVSIPYLRKMWAGEIKEFQIYYIMQGFAGLILSAIVVILVAPNMLVSEGATFIQLVSTNFVIGFGSTSLINEIFALRDLKSDNTPVATP